MNTVYEANLLKEKIENYAYNISNIEVGDANSYLHFEKEAMCLLQEVNDFGQNISEQENEEIEGILKNEFTFLNLLLEYIKTIRNYCGEVTPEIYANSWNAFQTLIGAHILKQYLQDKKKSNKQINAEVYKAIYAGKKSIKEEVAKAADYLENMNELVEMDYHKILNNRELYEQLSIDNKILCFEQYLRDLNAKLEFGSLDRKTRKKYKELSKKVDCKLNKLYEERYYLEMNQSKEEHNDVSKLTQIKNILDNQSDFLAKETKLREALTDHFDAEKVKNYNQIDFMNYFKKNAFTKEESEHLANISSEIFNLETNDLNEEKPGSKKIDTLLKKGQEKLAKGKVVVSKIKAMRKPKDSKNIKEKVNKTFMQKLNDSFKKGKEKLTKSNFKSKIQKIRKPKQLSGMKKRIVQASILAAAGICLFSCNHKQKTVSKVANPNMLEKTVDINLENIKEEINEKITAEKLEEIEVEKTEENEEKIILNDTFTVKNDEVHIYTNMYDATNETNGYSMYFSSDSMRSITGMAYQLEDGSLEFIDQKDEDFEARREALKNERAKIVALRSQNELGSQNGYEGYYNIEDIQLSRTK